MYAYGKYLAILKIALFTRKQPCTYLVVFGKLRLESSFKNFLRWGLVKNFNNLLTALGLLFVRLSAITMSGKLSSPFFTVQLWFGFIRISLRIQYFIFHPST